MPFAHGLRTSALVRPFGFAGSRSHSRARSPGMSKSPPFLSPMEAMPRFAAKAENTREINAGTKSPRR